MKVFVRIILLVVAVFAFIYGIPQLISNWNSINASGWHDIMDYPEKIAFLAAFISACGTCLLGLLALLEAILGRLSTLGFVVAAICIGLFVWQIISKAQAGVLTDFQSVWNVIVAAALPLGFGVGTLLLIFTK